MSTITKVFHFTGASFPYTSEGGTWATVLGANTTASMVSSGGNGTGNGYAQMAISGSAKTNANYFRWQGPWTALGVPTGATVSSVQVTHAWLCSAYVTGFSSSSGPQTFFDSVNTTAIVSPQDTNVSTFSGTSASYTDRASTTMTVLAAYQPATTGITLRLNDNLVTGASGSAAVTLRQSNVRVTVNYTAANTSLTGTGNLAALSKSIIPASMQSLGSINALAGISTRASVAGAGGVTAAGAVIVPGQAAFNGSGTVMAAGNTVITGQAALSGTGNLTAGSSVIGAGIATLAASTSINVSSSLITGASLTGTGIATSSVVEGAVSVPTGAGNVQALAVVSAKSAFTETGLMSALAVISANALLAGAGSAGASSSQIITGTAALSGSASMGASVAIRPAAALTAASTVIANGTVWEPGSAALSGSGVMSAIASVTGQAGAVLISTGNMAAQASQIVTATFTEAGSITAKSVLAAKSFLSGSSLANASGLMEEDLYASLAGQGFVSAVSGVSHGFALGGQGDLQAVASVSSPDSEYKVPLGRMIQTSYVSDLTMVFDPQSPEFTENENFICKDMVIANSGDTIYLGSQDVTVDTGLPLHRGERLIISRYEVYIGSEGYIFAVSDGETPSVTQCSVPADCNIA